jgi:hypothetical protein
VPNQKYKHSLSKGLLPLYKRHRVIEPVLNEVFRASIISLRLRCIRGTC